MARRALLGVLALLAVLGGACTEPTAPLPADRRDPPAPMAGTPTPDPPSPDRWVATDGDDDGPGTEDRPWATLGHALSQLRPGAVLTVHGGEYVEQVRGLELAAGTPTSPIEVRAAEGEQPVLRGLLWLDDPDHWTIQGLDVTWDAERNEDDDHMVKVTDGTGWQLLDAEIWGARSFAAVLVASSGGDEPRDWRIAGSCIHSTAPTNDTNQDHLVYVNSGLDSGPGVVEGNLLFDARNGNGVKLGGPREGSGGAADITVRHNTILGTAQSVLLAWEARGNVLADNVMAEVGDGYGLVRGYRLDGPGNVVRGTVGWGAASVVNNDDGHRGIDDGGDNVLLDAAPFAVPDRCAVPAVEGGAGATGWDGQAAWSVVDR